MPFVKVVKNRAYFKRFQTKYRRRREGKTDYKGRRNLITQDKNKYNSPKYRLVVRRTNTDVVCQITRALLQGDEVVMAAYAHELPKYGAKVGLTSYAGHYATGLLLARRLLTKFGLADKYEGNTNVDGSYYEVERGENQARPFKALLDVGLARTTTGARIFGALKGAVDGGVYVPHGEKRFPGFDKGSGELNSDLHRQRIFGLHVAEYQRSLIEEDEAKYDATFSRYKAAGITPDGVEGMWKEVHANIRKDPTTTTKEKKPGHKSYATPRQTTVQRKHRALQKKMMYLKKAMEG